MEEVGGGAVGETHEEGELVCDFPASGTIVQNCIRLREKVAQGLMVKLGSSDSKNALSVATHSAQGVQRGGGVSVCKGQERNTKAFTASESNEVASFGFFGPYNCIGEGAVGGKEAREGFDKFNNDRECGTGF